MQQLIWTDKKAIMFYYFPLTRYERNYKIWLLELDAERNTNWSSWIKYSWKIQKNKTELAHNQNDRMK